MSGGADAVLAHGLLNTVAAISASASTLRRVPPQRHEELCAVLERQSGTVEAFVHGMTDRARGALEAPLRRVASLTTRSVDLARNEARTPMDGLLSGLVEACETAAAALREFVQGFSPEMVNALDGLGERARDASDAEESSAPHH